MTKAKIKELVELVSKGCTDSAIEDWCWENDVSTGEAFHVLAVLSAPPQCKGCKHIDMFPNLPPCSTCSRAGTDNYEKE